MLGDTGGFASGLHAVIFFFI